MTSTPLPHGAWPSPIGAHLAAAHDGRPEFPGCVGVETWWTEPRPAEGGRRALIRLRPGAGAEPVLPAPWNARSRVIEYGGHPWAAVARPEGPLAVFVNFQDQRLYAYEPDVQDAAPRPLTPSSGTGGGLRWVDPRIHPSLGEVWCVLEEFTGEGPGDLRRVLAAVPLDGSAAGDRGALRELTDDARRFLTGPRLSPDGTRAAWLAWDHPLMPWDGTEIQLADVTPDGVFGPPVTVEGGTGESISQVEWDTEGRLLFAGDRSGWWNLYRREEDGTATPLCPRDEEFAGALWRIGQRWFAPLDDGRIAVTHGVGTTSLGVLDPGSGHITDVEGTWTEWTAPLDAHGDRVVAVAASPATGHEVIETDTASAAATVIGARHEDVVDPAYYPTPRTRVFHGPGGRDIHAQLYPPQHPDHTAPDGELPPYVIWVHGGPTSRAPLVLDLEIAYFTSRGIGVAEVNYGGSTGYGRAYRDRLHEEWGVVDVEDCAAVARALGDEATADPRRLAIRGGSAGGWTAAASLATTDTYACAAISYPLLDLASWGTGGTHDFESHYLESLVGPLDKVPERYRERSPVEHAGRVTAPFLLLQGLDDVICPPIQCERFLKRMAGRGVPHAYLTFEGESHGFRREDTLVRVLEAELALYAQVFGLDVPGLAPLELTE